MNQPRKWRWVCWAMAAVGCGVSAVAAEPRDTPVKKTTLDRAIASGAEFLCSQSLPSGQFVYRVNTNPAVQIVPKYNMLRHAGTMYALADVLQRKPSPQIKQVLQRAQRFLLTQVAPLEDVPDVLAVWSDPQVNGGSRPRLAKLGGAGLGLVASCRVQDHMPGLVDRATLVGLGDFILFMQREYGSFFSRYQIKAPHRDITWTSLYYPGEAALGLLMLNRHHPDEAWVDGAHETLTYLAGSRAGQETVPADHWALIATQELLTVRPSLLSDQAVIGHACQVARQILREQASQLGHQQLHGCFGADGRTTPCSTRLEGLLATLAVLRSLEKQPGGLLPAQAELQQQIELACHRGVRFLLSAQLQHGTAAGGLPRAVVQLQSDHPLWSPSFNSQATEVRIDYVQHALSAWIAYHRLLAL